MGELSELIVVLGIKIMVASDPQEHVGQVVGGRTRRERDHGHVSGRDCLSEMDGERSRQEILPADYVAGPAVEIRWFRSFNVEIEARASPLDLVFGDLGVVARPEDAFMDEGEMGSVHEVLDRPAGGAFPHVVMGNEASETSGTPLVVGENGDVADWIIESHPDQSIASVAPVDDGSGLGRNWRARR